MKQILMVSVILCLTRCGHGQKAIEQPSKEIYSLKFSQVHDPLIKFVYDDTTGNDYLRKLRQEEHLLLRISNCKTDIDKMIMLTSWVNGLWSHNGNNEPLKRDARSILEEVSEGKNFRCVEYGIVLSAALNAVGIPSRILALKTRDVEYVTSGAGHVCVEAYSRTFKKWVMADAQFNVIPFYDSIPLNAVEFQDAIYNHNDIQLVNAIRKISYEGSSYSDFIPPYLYYFDVPFDNRCEPIKDKMKAHDKSKLMLVPVGAKNPTIFQVNHKISNSYYTNSLRDFYPPLE